MMLPPVMRIAILIFLMSGISLGQATAAEDPHAEDLAIFQALENRCQDCHWTDSAEAGLDLAQFTSVQTVAEDRTTWVKIRDRIRDRQMPPPDMPQFEDDEREAILAWIDSTLKEAACGNGPAAGPAIHRRLNKQEYSASVRDLLGIYVDVGAQLPADGAGGEGFDNAAETLFISPIHGEKYLEAAKQATDYALNDVRARQRILSKPPENEDDAPQAARQVLSRLAEQGFRRPVTAEELDRLMTLYQHRIDQGDPWEEAVFFAIRGILVSPKFLFILEEPNRTDTMVPVTDLELATRLSYFLWGTFPDDKLLEVAKRGELTQGDNLRTQVERMLKHRNARSLAERFMGQWLHTRDLGTEFQPDREIFKRFNDELANAFREEPVRLLEYIVQENRSLLELLDADYTFMNNQLARHYQMPDDLVRKLDQHMSKVDLPEDSMRGGILTMAASLTVTSFPNRTSPVLRGKWLMENILGVAAAPPPPDIPPLEAASQGTDAVTVRQQLELHRANPTCASCHNMLDPLGFALESFDAIGRFRDQENGQPIDSQGALPGGEAFDGAEELKAVLLAEKERFVQILTQKMFGFALGRGLIATDYCAADEIVEQVKQSNYQSHSLVLGIVNSVPFRYKAPAVSGQTKE